ncbi:MAG: CapA family protein [Bacteroidota bacterium]
MKKIFLQFFVLAVIVLIVVSPRPSTVLSGDSSKHIESYMNDTARKITLLFVGDVMQHGPQIRAAYNPETDTYNYTDCFQYVKPYISKANIAIANFEVTLAGKPYAGYPVFSAPDELANELKNVGFDLLITANNHCLDRGKNGLEKTISKLDNLGIYHTGTFVNDTFRKQNYPFVLLKDGFKLAFLNYTFGTNGIEVDAPNVVNYIDKKQIENDLLKAKLQNPDFVIVTMHWGVEYQRKQNQEQEDLAKFCFENGADLIIGMHPHVVQPIETISYICQNAKKEGVVYYSLGNYVSNQRAQYKDGGIMAEIELTKNMKSKQTKLSKNTYIPVWVYKQEMPSDTNFMILPSENYQEYVTKFNMSEKDKSDFKQFISDTKELLEENK